MTYLTHIPARQAAYAGIGGRDADKQHQAVMALFADDLPETDGHDKRATAGILFRIEPTGDVLIRSNIEPTRAVEGARTVPVRPVAVDAGTTVRFSLAVNNVRRSKNGTQPVAATTMLDRLLDGALTDIDVWDERVNIRQRKGAALSVSHVDGAATVVDAGKLNELLNSGVGRSRAYGCGLLTLALL